MSKACKECGAIKPLEEYWLHNQAADGRHGVCAECMRARIRSRPTDHPQRVRDRAKAREYQKRPDIMVRENERHAKRYYANHDKIRAQVKAAKFRRKYGITPEQADHMLVAQGGVCAICKTSEWTKSGPSVDHCHESNRVRAILCNRCNAAIGFAKEDPARLRAAAVYIEHHSSRWLVGIGAGLL